MEISNSICIATQGWHSPNLLNSNVKLRVRHFMSNLHHWGIINMWLFKMIISWLVKIFHPLKRVVGENGDQEVISTVCKQYQKKRTTILMNLNCRCQKYGQCCRAFYRTFGLFSGQFASKAFAHLTSSCVMKFHSMWKSECHCLAFY